ncbi:methionyl-tRNA formyltransferase [Methylophilaceae bacterium]|nr:methionyl-tRNA formyltransferase [Methylophilaceae bacterium]
MDNYLKIIFAGTPEFSVPTLIALNTDYSKVIHVLTQPDKKSGRGMKNSYSPVKKTALRLNIPILQPISLKDNDAFEILEASNADILIVAAYGLIIPSNILALFPMGCYNVHASLLPRWRGAAPIHRAIEAGDKATGVTIMKVVEKLDAGPMLISKSIDLDKNITTGEVTKNLANIGAILMKQIVSSIQKKETISIVEQRESLVTYAGKINKSEARLNMCHAPEVIVRKINSLNPYPGAAIIFRDKILKIWKADVIKNKDKSIQMSIGELYTYNEELILKLENGVIKIIELQPEGKTRMDASSFIRGHEITKIEKIT